MAPIRGLIFAATWTIFLESIDIAQGNGPPSDLLLFHEFPITGFSEWTREQHYDLALEVPGPEIDEVAKKAQQYNCYIVFGTYAKDLENWPDHILHLMVMVGPEGNVVAKHWKQRNVRGLFPGGEMYTSVIYDVYDHQTIAYRVQAKVSYQVHADRQDQCERDARASTRSSDRYPPSSAWDRTARRLPWKRA